MDWGSLSHSWINNTETHSPCYDDTEEKSEEVRYCRRYQSSLYKKLRDDCFWMKSTLCCAPMNHTMTIWPKAKPPSGLCGIRTPQQPSSKKGMHCCYGTLGKDMWNPNTKAALDRWNSDTGGGAGRPHIFIDFCRPHKWMTHFFCMDLHAVEQKLRGLPKHHLASSTRHWNYQSSSSMTRYLTACRQTNRMYTLMLSKKERKAALEYMKKSSCVSVNNNSNYVSGIIVLRIILHRSSHVSCSKLITSLCLMPSPKASISDSSFEGLLFFFGSWLSATIALGSSPDAVVAFSCMPFILMSKSLRNLVSSSSPAYLSSKIKLCSSMQTLTIFWHLAQPYLSVLCRMPHLITSSPKAHSM